MRKLHILAAAAAMTASSLFADVQIGKGLSIGGYLDMYFQKADADLIAGGAAASAMGYNVRNAEVDFKMDFGAGLTAQVDLDSTTVRAVGSPANAAVGIEQARLDYKMGAGTLTLGKFDTFIGLEALESPDLYQFSKSFTTAHTPTQHEGLSYKWDNGKFNFAGAVVNGIATDNNNVAAHTIPAPVPGDKEELAYMAHLGLTPMEALAFNLNYAIGDDESGVDSTLMTVDASYSNHGWTVGAEYVKHELEFGGASKDRTAYMLMINYMFNEQFGLTGRYSTSEDETVATTKNEADEFTLAASYAFTPNWTGLLEYRTEEVELNHSVAGAYAAALTGQEADVITLQSVLTF